jgi:AraC family transcriptional regulator
MTFNSTTFKSINDKKNVAVRSALYEFESTVDSSGLSIKLPISGTENYKVDNVNYQIKPGNFLLVNKGQQVACKLDSKNIIESICIYLDNDIYLEIMERAAKKQQLDIALNHSEASVISDKYFIMDCPLSKTLSSFLSLRNVENLTEEDYILITEKLAFHQLDQKQMISSIDALNYITKTELLKRLRAAKSFIFENYGKNLNLDDISQASCLSKYHLLRSFKDVYNTTPYQALLDRRINKAKEMLQSGDAIQDVAIKCGFNDRRSFSRVFKKVNGKTPSSYLEDFGYF